MPRDIALVGIGKIAMDQHLPALRTAGDWRLVAGVDRSDGLDDVPVWADIGAMLSDCPDVGVVSLTLPPGPRIAMARQALDAGRHVMVEKPPAATLAECQALAERARAAGLTLYFTWHNRMAHAVAPARDWLSDRTIRRVDVTWAENVRETHPGQDWVFEAGGFGVFDPGINALSVLTAILPGDLWVSEATLSVPRDRQTPIAADVTLGHSEGAAVTARFDWDHRGERIMEIRVETDDGELRLMDAGATLVLGDQTVTTGPDREYAGLYAVMADLVAAGESETDLRPLTLTADAFLRGRRETVDAFSW